MKRREFLSASARYGLSASAGCVLSASARDVWKAAKAALSGGVIANGAPLVLRSSSAAAVSQSIESRIEVLLGEPIGRIAPEVYGHFVEHLGGVVYGGVWVGEQSKVPNIGGVRKSL